MASIAGRPYNVGFTFRVISADYNPYQNISKVTEYNYNKVTFALEQTTQLLPTEHYELGRGQFLEFTAGRNKDQFTVVFVGCEHRCEVGLRIAVTIYRIFW